MENPDDERSLEAALQMQQYDVWLGEAQRLAEDMARRGTDYLELTISVISIPGYNDGRDGVVADDGAELFLAEFQNELWKAGVFICMLEESEARQERRAVEMPDGETAHATFTISEYSMRLR